MDPKTPGRILIIFRSDRSQGHHILHVFHPRFLLWFLFAMWVLFENEGCTQITQIPSLNQENIWESYRK